MCQYMTGGCFPIPNYAHVPQITRSDSPDQPVVVLREPYLRREKTTLYKPIIVPK